MKTIEFTETSQVDYHLGDGLETFVAGQQYTFERDDKAERWVVRGVAFEVPNPEGAEPAESEDLAEMKRLAESAKAKSKK